MKDLVAQVANYLSKVTKKYQKLDRVPYIWYLDARFSSIAAFNHLKSLGHYTIMSCSATMAPQFLPQFLRGPISRPSKLGYLVDGKHYPYPKQGQDLLNKLDWRVIYNDKMDALFIVLRAKKGAFLNLLINYSDATAQVMKRLRLKYPKGKYDVMAPRAQKEYNSHKNNVDEFNRAILQYMTSTRTAKVDHKYDHLIYDLSVDLIIDVDTGSQDFLFKLPYSKCSPISECRRNLLHLLINYVRIYLLLSEISIF